ncbi:serine protease [Halorhodospira abdelmalekii]|uniref:NfeD family protein n=1 Tax=Halorhodospira abdelmalekii TaxID=421629 RepID=UPI0019088038|nr:nodulation protein NfeD [Halorhodospira abdelmalekii]MBK1734273.1 serine protease [Halorhodospira abdelmalekii]
MWMRRLVGYLVAITAAFLLSATTLGGEEEARGSSALLLDVKGPIGPATTDYITRGLGEAEGRGAELVILRLNTPGGLDEAMRDIISAILASPVPVATYVAPSGARAASAGTYILYASHVAAMAPATTLGAATPVQLGANTATFSPAVAERGEGTRFEEQIREFIEAFRERIDNEEREEAEESTAAEEERAERDDEAAASDETNAADEKVDDEKADDERREGERPGAMERKIIEDAVSYIRGLAELRGRNADWAERAVRESVSASSSEAVELNIIDFVAEDIDDLLAQADGMTVKLPAGERELRTSDLQVELHEPDWRNQLLAVLTNPNVAYILMLIGIYGIIFELMNPGSLVPGVLGGISLLLALYAFQALPIAYAGLALIFLGIAFMIAEAFLPSFGILGIGGAIAFVLGSVMLFDTDVEGFEISLAVIAGFTVASLVVFIGVAMMAARAWRRPKLGGADELINAEASADGGFAGDRAGGGGHTGHVRYAGERWRAVSERPVRDGQRVRIIGKEGLTLQVEPDE